MIYTITLNPALDRTIWIKNIHYDDANRIEKEEKYAGGKGIDVSRVLGKMDVINHALGFLGGYTGMEVEGLLLQEGIYCDFTPIANDTRTNIVLNISQSDQQVLFSASGPEIRPAELTAFFQKLEQLPSPEYVTISGSLPENLSPIIYARSIEILKRKNARVLLDTDGENLRIGITAEPTIIKPNIHELSRLVKRDLSQLADIVAAAEEIQQSGIEIVLVSMGARGILLVTSEEKYLAVPPQVTVVNTIGAGDSSVAGFIFGLVSGMPLKESLRYAAAAGTATTLQPGTALAQHQDIEQILPQVDLKSV